MLRATGMLNAVEYLHSNNIVHRDIKLANFCTGADSRANKVDRLLHYTSV